MFWPKLRSTSKLHFWYWGFSGLCDAENNPGGENPGTDALICGKVAPLLKPARNAAFEAAVAAKRLLTSPGAILGVATDELMENALKAGEFCAKLSTTMPGKAS